MNYFNFIKYEFTCIGFFVSVTVSVSSSLFITKDAGLLIDLSEKGFPPFSLVVVTIHV